MGFSKTATTHHFLLFDNGGAIQVEANSATDKASIDEIRMHLSHISKMFADGQFDVPMFVHDTVPPGVPEMRRLKSAIRYSFEETGSGGRGPNRHDQYGSNRCDSQILAFSDSRTPNRRSEIVGAVLILTRFVVPRRSQCFRDNLRRPRYCDFLVSPVAFPNCCLRNRTSLYPLSSDHRQQATPRLQNRDVFASRRDELNVLRAFPSST
jgi:hypothetical protein